MTERRLTPIGVFVAWIVAPSGFAALGYFGVGPALSSAYGAAPVSQPREIQVAAPPVIVSKARPSPVIEVSSEPSEQRARVEPARRPSKRKKRQYPITPAPPRTPASTGETGPSGP